MTGAHPVHICIGTGHPCQHLHLDLARPAHICAGTGLAPLTSAPGPDSPLSHLHRDCALSPLAHLRRCAPGLGSPGTRSRPKIRAQRSMRHLSHTTFDAAPTTFHAARGTPPSVRNAARPLPRAAAFGMALVQTAARCASLAAQDGRGRASHAAADARQAICFLPFRPGRVPTHPSSHPSSPQRKRFASAAIECASRSAIDDAASAAAAPLNPAAATPALAAHSLCQDCTAETRYGLCTHPAHICPGSGLNPATSAPRPRPPLPHLHQDWARPATSAPALGSPLPHLPRVCAAGTRYGHCARRRRRSSSSRSIRSRTAHTSVRVPASAAASGSLSHRGSSHLLGVVGARACACSARR